MAKRRSQQAFAFQQSQTRTNSAAAAAQARAKAPLKGSNPGATIQPGTSVTATNGVPGPAVAPQPIDPQFEYQKAAATRNLQVGQLGAAYQGAQIGNEYGFGSDKSNPYSQAKLLEESWKRSKLGTTNNYASSGQLHSGAFQRMQGENDRNYSIGVDRGTRDMNDALANVALGQMQNSADYGFGVAGDDFQSLLNAFRQRFG